MEAIFIVFLIFMAQNVIYCTSAGVNLQILDHHVVIDNGIIQLNISKPEGQIMGLAYDGNPNLIDRGHGGYYDLNWASEGTRKTRGGFDKMAATTFKVIVQNDQQLEVSFSRPWDPKQEGKISPLNIDKRYTVLSKSSGFYCYGVFEHTKDMPAFQLNTARIAFMLNKQMFKYMAVADDIRRDMPGPDDRLAARGQALEYREAVKLINPLEPQFKGEVDDKYQYTQENKDNVVHGWISKEKRVGFWQIAPSNEFRTGGPFKQDLTSHVGPATLAIFISTHYAGLDNVVKIEAGEEWKKVFGPVFIYLNKAPENVEPTSLWYDAKKQMNVEVQSWPRSFIASKDFAKAGERGTVSGKLLVSDTYISKGNIPANFSYVGLALPGDAGSWQNEVKGYQFWTKTDKDGLFTIKNIVAGEYNLFASVPGFVGDYRLNSTVKITPGGVMKLGDVVYKPPRDGPTLWEIGYPNRLAVEFNVPEPNPSYINKLFVNHPDRFRQYGIWERYEDLYPKDDLVFTVGTSDYKKDWFYAQVTRKMKNGNYTATTWQIRFDVKETAQTGSYKLRLALASAHASELQVRVNDPKTSTPLFTTGAIGKDNAIARHGIHGIYYLFNVDIPSKLIVNGKNTIYLTQALSTSPFQGIMYDYIRLEGPPPSKSTNATHLTPPPMPRSESPSPTKTNATHLTPPPMPRSESPSPTKTNATHLTPPPMPKSESPSPSKTNATHLTPPSMPRSESPSPSKTNAAHLTPPPMPSSENPSPTNTNESLLTPPVPSSEAPSPTKTDVTPPKKSSAIRRESGLFYPLVVLLAVLNFF